SGQTNRNEPLVVMTGSSLTLVYFEYVQPSKNSAGWRTYRVPMVEAPLHGEGQWFKGAWSGPRPTHQEMVQVLSSLTTLWIRGKADPGRSGRLDNVAIVTTCADNPALTIQQLDPNHALLSWPLNALCYQLEESPFLSPPV